MKTPRRESLAHVVGAALGIAALVFIATRVHRDWARISETVSGADPVALLAAVLAGLASTSVIGVNWLSLIRRSGRAAPVSPGLSWFFVGQLGKYVPGGIWPVVGQAELAARAGVDRRTSYGATLESMALTLFAAVAVAAVAGFASPYDRRAIALLLSIAVIAVMVSLAAPQIRSALERVLSLLSGRRGRLPAVGDTARYAFRHAPVWVLFGIMNSCVLIALGGDLEPGLAVDLLFASTLSWIAGFVVVGVPGGLGVRESVLVAMTSTVLGAPQALALAVTSRIVTLTVDVVGATVAAATARASHGSDTREHSPAVKQ